MSISTRVLLVDDEQSLLDSVRRAQRGAMDLTVACGSEEGLKAIKHPSGFAVIVTDYRMPGMDGIALLQEAATISPNTVRLMLTGNADLQSAINAVNEGSVFRYMRKPCDKETFLKGVTAALEQHRLIVSEKQLLEQTLRGSVQVLIEALSLCNPAAFGRSTRIQHYVKHAIRRLFLTPAWQIETAAMLSQVGCVGVPPEVIERLASGETLTDDQAVMIKKHPEFGRKLIAKIPRMEAVAEIIAYQNLGYTEPMHRPDGGPVPAASRVLAAAMEFDELTLHGLNGKEIVARMRAKPEPHDEKLLMVLEGASIPGQVGEIREVAVTELREGMTLVDDVVGSEGSLVVATGNRITVGMIARLNNYARIGKISRTVTVRVPA